MTETTQPDPQVVAWEYAMVLTWPDGYEIDGRRRGEITPDPDRAFLGTTDGREARTLYRRRPAGEWEPAPSKPLTLADIPAGQGPASLFLVSRGDDFDLCFKHGDGRVVVIGITLDQLSGATTAALTDHLAATLPHVTTEETH